MYWIILINENLLKQIKSVKTSFFSTKMQVIHIIHLKITPIRLVTKQMKNNHNKKRPLMIIRGRSVGCDVNYCATN
jgi:hypothetical protein